MLYRCHFAPNLTSHRASLHLPRTLTETFFVLGISLNAVKIMLLLSGVLWRTMRRLAPMVFNDGERARGMRKGLRHGDLYLKFANAL